MWDNCLCTGAFLCRVPVYMQTHVEYYPATYTAFLPSSYLQDPEPYRRTYATQNSVSLLPAARVVWNIFRYDKFYLTIYAICIRLHSKLNCINISSKEKKEFSIMNFIKIPGIFSSTCSCIQEHRRKGRAILIVSRQAHKQTNKFILPEINLQ